MPHVQWYKVSRSSEPHEDFDHNMKTNVVSGSLGYGRHLEGTSLPILCSLPGLIASSSLSSALLSYISNRKSHPTHDSLDVSATPWHYRRVPRRITLDWTVRTIATSTGPDDEIDFRRWASSL